MIAQINKSLQPIRFAGNNSNANFKRQIAGKTEKIDVDQQLADDIFNTALDTEEAEMKKYEELENKNAPLAKKKTLLTELRRFINNSKAKIEKLLVDSRKEMQNNITTKKKEEQAAKESKKSIQCSEIAKLDPKYSSKENALRYFDRNIESRRNSLDMHRENIDMAETLNERHEKAIIALNSHIDRLKKDANTINLRLQTVDQSRHVSEAIETMSRYNRVVRPSYLDTNQDVEHLDAQLRQLELLDQSSEESDFKRYLQNMIRR